MSWEVLISPFLYFCVLIALLFLMMVVFIEAGRRLGLRHRRLDPDTAKAGIGTIDAAVFGLLGLIIAFTFSGAATRFDGRRQLIGEETNAIGTAYLRIDLLPLSAQSVIRDDFKNYLDARIGMYRNIPVDLDAAKREFARATDLQKKIWSETVAACRDVCSAATASLVFSSLNAMIDITTTRYVALETHPPAVIFWGLGILLLIGALLAGYEMAEAKRPSRVHMLIFPLILTTAVFVIVDMEYPRMGLIRIEKADHLLTDLRATMK